MERTKGKRAAKETRGKVSKEAEDAMSHLDYKFRSFYFPSIYIIQKFLPEGLVRDYFIKPLPPIRYLQPDVEK